MQDNGTVICEEAHAMCASCGICLECLDCKCGDIHYDEPQEDDDDD